MSLVHGGGAFSIFCPTVYNFLCGMKPSDLIASVDEIPDSSIREILKQVQGYTQCLGDINSMSFLL